MSILTKNKDTLTRLFATFSLQEVFQVNQNLEATWPLLTMPPETIVSVLKDNKIGMESFLSTKCLLLSRFYLSDSDQQKSIFLSQSELAELFRGLPAVEAFVFKEQITRALEQAKKANQALLGLLIDGKSAEGSSELNEQAPVLQLTDYPEKNEQLKVQRLNDLAESENDFLDCFYYLQDGELYILEDETENPQEILMYSELSPIQQLTAQTLFQRTGKMSKAN